MTCIIAWLRNALVYQDEVCNLLLSMRRISRWCDKCLFTTNARDWFIDTLEWTTTLLYGSLQGLYNLAGVLKAHALTKRDACANCRAKNNYYCYDACANCRAKLKMHIAMMRAHTARHDVTCHIIYRTILKECSSFHIFIIDCNIE